MVEPAQRRFSRVTGLEDDIDAVLRQLSDGALVTVTGSGGIGKTTLATAVLNLVEEDLRAWIDLLEREVDGVGYRQLATIRDYGVELDLAGLLLIYPLVNPVADTASRLEYASGYVIERADLEWFGGQYLNSPDEVSDPRIALGRADLSGLPPTLILTNEFDTLRDEVTAEHAEMSVA